MQAAKLISISFAPWRKYNGFFDKGCWGIWGLSPLLKYTLLFLALFFVPPIIGLVDYANSDSYFSIITIFFLLIALIWIIYFPILAIITLFRAIKKVESGVKDLNIKLQDEPWKMTPKKLYTQPHSIFFLYLIYAKNSFIDFADWCTQFFLFDFIYPDRIRYPLTKKIRHNSRHIESLIADMNIPLKYVGFEVNMQNINYKFEFYEEVKSTDKVLSKLEKGFKKTDYYVREDNGRIHVTAPHHQK